MKICIPTEEAKGLESVVYGHFGSAPAFAIVDTTDQSVKEIANANAEHEHGQCHPVQFLLDNDVDIVVVGGMGQRALSLLNSQGIRVFRTDQELKVWDFIHNVDSVVLYEMTPEHACGHNHGGGHSCGHDHGHGHDHAH
ncbi:MAG: NifB/NifX family molybdenum-iron cluster-binding protein [Chloroflexota bacterium]